MGTDKPDLIITEILSPFCSPCGSSMKKAKELLRRFPERVQIRILFTNKKKDAEKNQEIISHLLSLSKKADQKLIVQALSDWFEIMDYAVWCKKYPIKGVPLTEKEVADYFAIIKSYQIKHTPFMYVGSKQIPSNLSISDLRYYFDDILN
jgi:tetrahydrodipicolinate N-succinyltransferase